MTPGQRAEKIEAIADSQHITRDARLKLFASEIIDALKHAEATACVKCQRAAASYCWQCYQGEKKATVEEALAERLAWEGDNIRMIQDAHSRCAHQADDLLRKAKAKAYEDAVEILFEVFHFAQPGCQPRVELAVNKIRDLAKEIQ